MYQSHNINDILLKLKTVPSESLECETIEFKEYRDENALHNAKDLAEEISALANKEGGIIVIGVRDSSNVSNSNWQTQLVGFPSIDIITSKARLTGKLKPSIELKLFYVVFEGKNYLVVQVPRRRDTLVITTSGKVYIRDGRSSRPMNPDEIESAVKALQKYDWSSEEMDIDPSKAFDPSALEEALRDFTNRRGLEKIPDHISFLEAIGATKNGVVTKGGLLFLGQEETIRQTLGDFEYRFSWKTRSGKLIINDVWSGCIWHAIKRAKNHFDQCNNYTDIKFEDKFYKVPLLDKIAFHEAYLNALVHRDYSCDGTIAITFNVDKLIITSPGLFYGGVTADNIVLHEPRHRNKSLARLLMLYQMVDRAGMGVLRMGLHSLMYGRSFPEFHEITDSVQVVMSAEFIRPSIFVLTANNQEQYDIPELLLLNSLYEVGSVSAKEIQRLLRRVVQYPWQSILDAVSRLDQVELCGNNKGVFLRVKPSWSKFFSVSKTFKPATTSDKHVKLYIYLKKHGQASNEDITNLLEHNYSSQTSVFLKKTEYVKRTGSGPSSIWSLQEDA